jgi:hypothetical protein
MIARFFVSFFGGVCLDPAIGASSRVLQDVLRMFAPGDEALPAMGMEQIPRQLARDLSRENIKTGIRVRNITENRVELDDGTSLSPLAVVVATEGPEVSRLLGMPQMVPPGLFIAGEHGHLPGIQWAMLFGRKAAEAVTEFFN